MDSHSPSIFSGEITTTVPQCRHPRSRSSSSASSSSSSSAGCGADSPFSPISSFIPFSWEQHPGIPKTFSTKDTNNLMLDDHDLLPLPPPKKFDFGIRRIGRSSSSISNYYKADPFVAALVKCSRENREEDQWPRSGGVVSRAVSDRFGLKIDRYMLSSCKSSCGVVEPIVIRTSRPNPSHRSGYSLIRKS